MRDVDDLFGVGEGRDVAEKVVVIRLY